MAELNFGLLNPPGSQSIGNAFVQGMDQAAAARAQENQNAMSQYALSKARREDELTNQMLAGMQGADTIEKQADVLRRGGKYKEANQLLASGVDLNIKKGALAALPGKTALTAAQTDAANAALVRTRQQFEGQALRDLGVNPSDDNIRALGQDAVIKGIYTQPEADQKVAQFLAIPLADRAANFSRYGAPAAAPQQPRQPNMATDLLIPGPNGTMVPNTALIGVQTGLRQAGRAPAQPRPEQPPVSVVDPDTGKQVLVSREEAISKRMTPANAAEGLAPKEMQKREAAYPAATAAIGGFEKKSDNFVKDLIALRDHPGLSSITGIAAGRMPGLTADGRAAQALYDKVVAKGGFQALQDMRDASKTGGALGNVSNAEGKQLISSFAAIDRRQDAPDVQAAIDDAIANIGGARTRMREAYDSTYNYKQDTKPAAAAPALSSADQQALTWATANPKDPRSAQIKQRLGR